MIKVQKRAALTTGFKDAVRQAAQERLRKIRGDYDNTHPRMKKLFMTDNGMLISRMKEIVSDAGKQDQLWTRLRLLAYDEFAIEEWNDIIYLRGTTKDIVIEEERTGLGPYWVYVNIADYVSGDTKDLHFVPSRDPLNGLRFYHHHAKGPRYPLVSNTWSMPGKSLRLEHHLNAQPSTCWGSFGGFATTAFEVMDTAELFRTLHVYLSRHNPVSNLYPGGEPGVPRPMTLSFARAA